jgi:predicted transposase/invertase (TIGR01784 family)
MCSDFGRYINPFTDFGFKKLFGEENSKPQLISFLNAFLELEKKDKIVDLEFKNLEKLGLNIIDRKAIYDIYCLDESGNHIIVELQKAKQNWFKDRMVYYSSFPIQEQGVKGAYFDEKERSNKKSWNFKLKAVYCVGILDFEFSEATKNEIEIVKENYLHIVKLKDQHNNIFYDKLTFAFVEMPKFNKKESELKTYLDKWFYFLKNLDSLDDIPLIYKDEKVIIDAFKKAEYLNLPKEDKDSYFQSLKVYRDLHNVIDTAENEGFKKGKEEGKIEGEKQKTVKIAKKMLKKGSSIEDVLEITELSIEEIEKIKKEMEI